MNFKMDFKILVITGVLAIGLCSCSTTERLAEKKQENSDVPQLAAVSGADAQSAKPDLKKAALINVELGLGYLGQGQVARAKNKLTHAVKIAPELPETHSAMAHFLEMVGENGDAEKEHKKAIKQASNKGAFYNNYAVFLCRQKRYKEADNTFQEALNDKEYDHSAEVYENAGVCALKWPDVEKARTYLEAAVRRDPTRTNAMLELASLNLNQGELQKVSELLGKYKSVAEPSARSLWLGIQVAKANNDMEAQETQILLLKNLFEDSPEYQAYLKMSGLKPDKAANVK